MKKTIACCGLDCERCEARLATVNNDDSLRQKIAHEWSELNGAEITPEMINCSGCRIEGVKTPYCDSLCPIRQCALKRGVETCGSCSEMDCCEELGMIVRNNQDALRNLKEYSFMPSFSQPSISLQLPQVSMPRLMAHCRIGHSESQ